MRFVLIIAAFLCAAELCAYAKIQQDVIERDTIGGGDLSQTDIDTFAELDAIVVDKGLVNLGDVQTLTNKILKGANNTVFVTARNAADTADVDLLKVDGGDDMVLGDQSQDIIIGTSFVRGADVDSGISMDSPNAIDFYGNNLIVSRFSRTTGLTFFDGGIIWNSDGGGDIGASGANRPDNIYAATGIFIGTSPVVKARGQTLFQLRAQANEPPASSFATMNTRNAHPALRFNGDVCAVWSFTLPESYSGNDVTVDFWYVSTETTNDTDWTGAWELIGTSLDIDADSFAAAVSSIDNNNNATSGIATKVTIAFTDGAQMDSCVAGELCRFKLCRDDTTDTGGADTIDYIGGEIRETP